MENSHIKNDKLFTKVNELTTTVDNLANAVKDGFDGVDKRFNAIDSRLDSMDGRLIKVESIMVDKDYLDKKLGQMEGRTVIRQRKQDQKTNQLINALLGRDAISKSEAESIQSIRIFPSQVI